MNAVAIVTILALIEYSIFGAMVGRARGKHGIEAPATAGNPEFERYFRVHQNTLEALIVFLPGLWLFAWYVSSAVAVALGLLFVVAGAVYAGGYIREPKRRSAGVAATFLINLILVAGGLVGAAIAGA